MRRQPFLCLWLSYSHSILVKIRLPSQVGAGQALPSLSTALSHKWHRQLSTLCLNACREQAVLTLLVPAGAAGSNSSTSLHIPLQLTLCLLHTPGEDQGSGAGMGVGESSVQQQEGMESCHAEP